MTKAHNGQVPISFANGISATFHNGVALVEGTPALLLSSGEVLSPGSAEYGESSASYSWENGLRLILRATAIPGGVDVDATLEHHGTASITIREIRIVDGAKIKSPSALDRALLNGEDMNTRSGLVDLTADCHSNSVIALSSTSASLAFVAGFLDVRHAFCNFRVGSRESAAATFAAYVNREGIAHQPKGSWRLPTLRITTGTSMSHLLDDYARSSGERMEARHTPLHTGWCSWYTYYGTENVEDVLENVQAFKDSPMAGALKTIQLDDGWNYTAPNAPRNWGDWEAGYKFPRGMKDIADRIRDAGFSPGLWLAPFSVDPGSEFIKRHPDLLVQDGERPKVFWECYGLDLTNPKALDFVRETFDRVFNTWGFNYIKIDFLLHAIQPGRRHDDSLTSAEVLRKGLQAIRDVAGKDRFILTCGCPMGPAVGICDAMRIGLDVSHRWYLPMNLDNWPWGNCSIYSGARHVIGRQWMDRRWWQNDPDCLLMHHDGSAGEKKMFSGHGELGKFASEPSYGLSEEEAAFWCRLVWLSGGMGMIGENIKLLRADRLALLEKAFPPNDAHARLVDYYLDPEVGVLHVDEPRPMIGLFNMSNKPHTVRLSRSESGLSTATHFREWLTDERLHLEGETLEFPELPPRSGRIWVAD